MECHCLKNHALSRSCARGNNNIFPSTERFKRRSLMEPKFAIVIIEITSEVGAHFRTKQKLWYRSVMSRTLGKLETFYYGEIVVDEQFFGSVKHSEVIRFLFC